MSVQVIVYNTQFFLTNIIISRHVGIWVDFWQVYCDRFPQERLSAIVHIRNLAIAPYPGIGNEIIYSPK